MSVQIYSNRMAKILKHGAFVMYSGHVGVPNFPAIFMRHLIERSPSLLGFLSFDFGDALDVIESAGSCGDCGLWVFRKVLEIAELGDVASQTTRRERGMRNCLFSNR